MNDARDSSANPPPPDFRVIGATSCAENLRSDDQLLRSGAPAVRVAVLSDTAVSYGVGVSSTSAYLENARAAGVPVVRRTTGGSGVLHRPGDLAWAIVLPRSDPRVGRDYVRAYDRLGRGPVRFLSRHGLAAAWTPPPGIAAGYCLLSSRGRVLSVDGRILGGAAQHLSGTALLHHGIVPREVDRPLLGRLFGPDVAREAGRLVSLNELSVTGTDDALANELARSIADSLGPG